MLRSKSLAVLARTLKQGIEGTGVAPVCQVLPGTVAEAHSVHTSAAAISTDAQKAGKSRSWLKRGGIAALGVATAAGFGAYALAEEESEHGLHAPDYPWNHEGYFSSYDHASIRRGHQVYQQVCAACHSVQQIHFRNLVGVAYTEDEVKEMADPLPRPYRNEEAARYANGGAYPPDLSLITKARHNGANYVFALLLGYREPPAGVHIREGLYYNPYFPGGAIAMPKMLADEGTEYDDGTVATEAQQAKDVTAFLSWAAEPEHDDRKLMGVKWIFVLSLVFLTAAYYKRWKWAPIKSRRVVVDALN
ncbi:hypothetical protein WJX79_002191 [Trebouxia sp. C0005]